MRKWLLTIWAIGLGAFALTAAAQSPWLWQIGNDDRQYREFALTGGAEGYHAFHDDPVFIVGASRPETDWPFIHPGPRDAWAGGRAHTFTIAFGLAETVTAGTGKLSVALVDTHQHAAPKLKIFINGQRFEQPLPGGAGDATLDGHAEQGKPFRFDIEFPATLLRRGANIIDLVNDDGSWILYDWLGLAAPGAQLAKLDAFTTAKAVGVRGLVEREGKMMQPVELTLRHAGPPVPAIVSWQGREQAKLMLTNGLQSLKFFVPEVSAETHGEVQVAAAGDLLTVPVTLQPIRHLTIYVLPHSHHDLGYTDFQTNIVRRQVENLRKAMAIAEKTRNYAPGARFVWNAEVLWSVDDFMRSASAADQAELLAAIRRGDVSLNAMYGNQLTGLAGPEELLQMFRYAQKIGAQCGVKVDAAMQSDVPGMTWGLAPAMGQAGVKYFSLAPNFFDRIGGIMRQWQDKPFWWVSSSGQERVLVWVPWTGYALSHIINHLSPAWVGEYQQRLDVEKFPYDITHIRWSGHGDNAEPDGEICEFIQQWNTEYAWPKFVIASTSEAFAAFEKRYGAQLPEYRGDLTPYWEDGAGSSALETALSRAAGERLTQAAALMAMRNPAAYDPVAFAAAWRNVLLYTEHTWGAWNSVSDSENPFVRGQWDYKRAFATEADKTSRALLAKALDANVAKPLLTGVQIPVLAKAMDAAPVQGVDVFNTAAWPRTGVVELGGFAYNDLGVAVKNGDGVLVQFFQTLVTWTTNQYGTKIAHTSPPRAIGLVRNVPPLAGVRVGIGAPLPLPAETRATATNLDNGILRVGIDPQTGDITELRLKGVEENFASADNGLNRYVYLPGNKLADLKTSGPARITILENGPVVAALRIESDAPGEHKLIRELRLAADADYVEIINTLDKESVPLNPRPGQDGDFAQRKAKESVSFAFPFNVPDGQMRLDIPLAQMRPDADQLPGACKDWLPVGRWADVSNARNGVTLVTLDAPLVELGQLSTLLGSQSNPDVWRKEIGTTQTIYSWVMNNHWGTNYRAHQEGVTTFRYALRPHRGFDPAEATRLAINLSQPLLVRPAAGPAPSRTPLFRVEPASVIVTALKPGDDGHSLIIRLFNPTAQEQHAQLLWPGTAPAMSISALDEKPGAAIKDGVTIPALDLVTIRVER